MTNAILLNEMVATYSRLKDYGPLEIDNLQRFLVKAKSDFNEKWNRPFVHKEKLDDFETLQQLGSGSFGNVILIKRIGHDKFYAMKCILKEQVMRQKQLEHTKSEKKVLQSLDFPMTVYLEFCFKDNCYVYLVMPFIMGGDLYSYHRNCGGFDEVQSRFYVSQIVLALEYLHYLDLVYRDLKPENILMDHTGYLKLIDFGFCKRLTNNRTYTFCGTSEYFAPEVILHKGYGKAVDWWATGVFAYEMVAGSTPFWANQPMKIYANIVDNIYEMPKDFSPELQDLVKNLLKLNLSERYGNLKNGVKDIKDHKWFRPINWLAILNRKALPPYRPPYSKPENFSNFETEEIVSLVQSDENKYENEFADF